MHAPIEFKRSGAYNISHIWSWHPKLNIRYQIVIFHQTKSQGPCSVEGDLEW